MPLGCCAGIPRSRLTGLQSIAFVCIEHVAIHEIKRQLDVGHFVMCRGVQSHSFFLTAGTEVTVDGRGFYIDIAFSKVGIGTDHALDGYRRHGALRIEQAVVVRAEAERDESARVGNRLGLPAVVSLKSPHRFLAGVAPGAGGFSGKIVLTNQRCLNLPRPFTFDFLLAPRAFRSLTM